MSNPYRAFRFVLEIDGIDSAGFSSVSGLERETTFEEYREGGINDFVHKLATLTKYPNLTLKRGITDATDLWSWHQKVIDGTIERRSMAVLLLDDQGEETWRWAIEGAYPVKWSGAELDAANNAVAAETLEFAHHGIHKQ